MAAQQSKQQSKSKPQWSWPNGMKARASYHFCTASRMAVTQQEGQRCRQANSMYSNPQQSWPTRAQDIAGELRSTASHSGLGQGGHKTLQASCVWQQAPAFLANKGTRHRGQAAFNSMPQQSRLKRARDITGEQHRKPQRSQPLRARDIAGEHC